MHVHARFEQNGLNKINTLFTGLGQSTLEKTAPSVLSMARGHHTQDIRHSFSQYWPTSKQITYAYFLEKNTVQHTASSTVYMYSLEEKLWLTSEVQDFLTPAIQKKQ